MKTIRRIIAIILILLTIMTSPLSVYFGIENNVYAAATTFIQDLESQMFIQTLIPTLIAAGLVFNSKESIEKVAGDTIEWLKEQGFDFKSPNEPDGPNLGDVIKEMLKGVTLVSAGYGIYKDIVEIPQMLWELVKSFVDVNYDEGENYKTLDTDLLYDFIHNDKITLSTKESSFYIYGFDINFNITKKHYLEWSNDLIGGGYQNNTYYVYDYNLNNEILETNEKVNDPFEGVFSTIERALRVKKEGTYSVNLLKYSANNIFHKILISKNNYPLFTNIDNIEKDYIAYGAPEIVDNLNYDWNNNYTDTKVIPIPIEIDPYGNTIKDENGYYLPTIDVDEWIEVQPTEIPNLDPTGTPIPDIPPFPDIENPDDDEQTGIMIYIGNILQIIVGQLSKIAEGVNTIVKNTNQMIFGTPTPVFDPTTGQQIDPETGEPIPEPEPETSTGDGIIGNGIDTNIPTDFEWGDFRHLLDIFFIFIYFIVILILIILKFLQIVFVGLPGIAANTDLFTQYPTILEGVNYVKNLQVGGLTITVHQAFEFVFLIFFYIFIIKQIRKLYNAAVYEESSINHDYKKDMRMDYYERNRHYKPNHFTNISRSETSQDIFKHAAVNPEDYNNINIIDYTEDN